MITDSLFEKVTLEVREVCESLNFECSFNRNLGYVNVYGRLTGTGRPILTATVIESIASLPNLGFNSVSIDSSCRLWALFYIKDDNVDGNTD